MQVQLGQAAAPQVTSTNWTNFLTDADICSESQFLPTPRAFDAPDRGVPVGISP